jgi:hypothetical protein
MRAFCLRSMALTCVLFLPVVGGAAEDEWPTYGHDLGGTRFPQRAIMSRYLLPERRIWSAILFRDL